MEEMCHWMRALLSALFLFPVPPRHESHLHVPATIKLPIAMDSPPRWAVSQNKSSPASAASCQTLCHNKRCN